RGPAALREALRRAVAVAAAPLAAEAQRAVPERGARGGERARAAGGGRARAGRRGGGAALALGAAAARGAPHGDAAPRAGGGRAARCVAGALGRCGRAGARRRAAAG